MAKQPRNPIVRAVTDLLWERDKRQMEAMDVLLSAVTPPKPRRAKPRRGRTAKGQR